LKIKEKITMVLEDITHSGEGVGRIDNMIVFVDGGVPGDTVEIEITAIKKTYMTGKILKLIAPLRDTAGAAVSLFWALRRLSAPAGAVRCSACHQA